jgi:DNA-binding NarL/FixJ family response regulator
MQSPPQSELNAPRPIRVCIVEDEPANRDLLATCVNDADGMRCVGVYASGEEALIGIPNDDAHVALVDIRLTGMSGIECVAQLRRLVPGLEALMLTTYEETDMIFDSMRAGAKGYLLKKSPSDDLIQAIEQIRHGGSPMSVQIARKVMDYFDRSAKNAAADEGKLTKRENEVLALLAQGFLYKEIGDRLGISMYTVKNYLHSIYEKLHVQSRTEAVIKYLKR